MPAAEKFLRRSRLQRRQLIVAPNSRIIAGPMGAEEGILYAECDLELGIQMKLRHDFAGHYNRPDIFHLADQSLRAQALFRAWRRGCGDYGRACRGREARPEIRDQIRYCHPPMAAALRMRAAGPSEPRPCGRRSRRCGPH